MYIAAYRKLARQLHPDKNAGRAGRDDDALPALCRWCLSHGPAACGRISPTQVHMAELFKRGNHAYSILSDPERRPDYDRAGHPCRGSRAVRATAKTAISCSLRARARGLRRALSRLCGWAHACSGAIRALLAEPRFTSLLAGEGEEAESERASERASKQETEQRTRTHSYSRHVCLHTRYLFTYMIPVCMRVCVCVCVQASRSAVTATPLGTVATCTCRRTRS